MKKRGVIVPLEVVRSEVLAPEAFLRLSKERPHTIARSRFLPPAIGRRDFGSFEVEYSVPVLKRATG